MSLMDRIRYWLEAAVWFLAPLLIEQAIRLAEDGNFGVSDWRQLGLFCVLTLLAWVRLQLPKPQPWDGIDRRTPSPQQKERPLSRGESLTRG